MQLDLRLATHMAGGQGGFEPFKARVRFMDRGTERNPAVRLQPHEPADLDCIVVVVDRPSHPPALDPGLFGKKRRNGATREMAAVNQTRGDPFADRHRQWANTRFGVGF